MKPLDDKKFPHLSEVQKNFGNKDMDKLGEEIYSLIIRHGLTMAKSSAIMFYVIQQNIKAPHNAIFLKEKLGLDVSNLGVEGILKVQQALVTVYLDELKKEK